MRLLQLVSLLAVAICAWACHDDSIEIGEKRVTSDSPFIYGKWRLSETGLSPGSGYYVTEVPASSNLYVTFNFDGTMESNIEGLEAMNYFRIKDQNDSTRFLSLYHEAPEFGIVDAEFYVTTKKQKLMLWSTICIEGCHMGFLPK